MFCQLPMWVLYISKLYVLFSDDLYWQYMVSIEITMLFYGSLFLILYLYLFGGLLENNGVKKKKKGGEKIEITSSFSGNS